MHPRAAPQRRRLREHVLDFLSTLRADRRKYCTVWSPHRRKGDHRNYTQHTNGEKPRPRQTPYELRVRGRKYATPPKMPPHEVILE